jgi:branched-chain amino acid transport system ATP-binding protein
MLSVSVDRGQVGGVMLGPNGHGKSTLLKAICGLAERMEGSISYQDQERSGFPRINWSTWASSISPKPGVVSLYDGFGQPQAWGLCQEMPVLTKRKTWRRSFSFSAAQAERKTQLASTMSGGEAKMLAVARGLMSNADFLCIDEPSLGLQPSLRLELFSTIKEINKQGKTILLVEQNIPQIAELADRIYVMEEGCISFRRQQGSPG